MDAEASSEVNRPGRGEPVGSYPSAGSIDAADMAELAELRRRAYGPGADIAKDPAALARLTVLEEAFRPAPVSSSAPATTVTVADDEPPATVRSKRDGKSTFHRWRVALVATAALGAVVLAGAVWDAIARPEATRGAGSDAFIALPVAVTEDQRWSTSSAAGYTQFLDHLRGELLATPGLEAFEDRVIFEELRPFGGLYGRKVWAGPTSDREYCMVIANEPEPITGCIPADDAASPLTIVLPAGRSDPKGVDTVLPRGNPISYTLLPGGTVVAAPVPGP